MNKVSAQQSEKNDEKNNDYDAMKRKHLEAITKKIPVDTSNIGN